MHTRSRTVAAALTAPAILQPLDWAAQPDRLLWGSDWPHTHLHAAAPAARVLMDCFARWTPAWVQQAIRWDNPKRLYGLHDRERVWL